MTDDVISQGAMDTLRALYRSKRHTRQSGHPYIETGVRKRQRLNWLVELWDKELVKLEMPPFYDATVAACLTDRGHMLAKLSGFDVDHPIRLKDSRFFLRKLLEHYDRNKHPVVETWMPSDVPINVPQPDWLETLVEEGYVATVPGLVEDPAHWFYRLTYDAVAIGYFLEWDQKWAVT